MINAPVLIPTLCRAEHFKRCLNSLAENNMAENTAVYVALDYPSSKVHEEGWGQIRTFLDSFDRSKFGELIIINREKNYGAVDNLSEAKRYVLNKYDRIIISEDDNEFSPVFLEYMNSALDLYQNDPRVDSICGYSYPFPWVVAHGANAFFCDSTFSAWGYGTWRDKSEKKRGAD